MSVAQRPAGARLSDDQRRAWLRLIRSDRIGPVTFRELLNHFGSASAALEAVPDLAGRSGSRIRIYPVDETDREIAAADEIGARFVALGEPDFPVWLRLVDGAPPLLAIRGDAGCLARPVVAIVGSRNASVAGRKIAMQLASGLGAHDFCIASGLARGIDAAAHQASIATGTAAVFAGGLDRVYPQENTELAAQILDGGGAHLSEMPMGHEARARDFPRRNRIVSGISLGVVIVEAAVRSGSLITARLAAEQGRLVFAVPGSPLDPRSVGTNRLIKDGARPVTEVDDILPEIMPMVDRTYVPPPEMGEDDNEPPTHDAGDSDRATIVEALGPTPIPVDEIIRFTGLRPAIVQLVLLELDLAGRLERHPGQRVSLTG
jgi:DNA processing protein